MFFTKILLLLLFLLVMRTCRPSKGMCWLHYFTEVRPVGKTLSKRNQWLEGPSALATGSITQLQVLCKAAPQAPQVLWDKAWPPHNLGLPSPADMLDVDWKLGLLPFNEAERNASLWPLFSLCLESNSLRLIGPALCSGTNTGESICRHRTII